jgi:arginine-tRNA-protein transferase
MLDTPSRVMSDKAREMTRLRLYRSGQHDCAYLDHRAARTLFVDPARPKGMSLYSALIDQGFRRSGEMIYRPDCDACQACQSIRLPVDQFKPRRGQRRIWQRLQSKIQVTEYPAQFQPQHYELFLRYLQQRHPDGEMADTSEQGYLQFIASPWSETRLFEFRLDQRLLAVAVTDLLSQGMSAVYTFFEPEQAKLSPGVFTLLWQIEACRARQLPWLYLGYWIADCRKMAYKTQYQPYERFVAGRWEPYTPGNS